MSKLQDWLGSAWKWITALWAKHDEDVLDMAQAIMPIVINMAFRTDLTGEQKKKAVVDAVLDNAGALAAAASSSMINEAVEIALNKYNIQIGKTTIEKIDAARNVVLKAGRDYANGKLKITGDEAEKAGIPIIQLPTPASEVPAAPIAITPLVADGSPS
jgi:hypothetical protein